MKIRRALISVYDKERIVDLAKTLVKYEVEIISTGKTASILRENGISTKDITDLTGFPEILGGRVKTLHPRVFGAILADETNAAHKKEVQFHELQTIQLVVVNLYPFENTINDPGHTLEDAIENIDIGGVSLIRAAAKNFKNCVCVCSIGDYDVIINELVTNNGDISEDTSRRLAFKAFRRTTLYDNNIQNYLGNYKKGQFPTTKLIHLTKATDLRYGENPHQKAAAYKFGNSKSKGLLDAQVLNGKELSFNNLMDLDAAFSVVRNISRPACCIIKHTNPCGAAIDETSASAFKKALRCDIKSSFGGIIAFNREVDVDTAEAITEKGNFFEAIIAPFFDPLAIKILSTKRKWGKNVRLVEYGEIQKPQPGHEFIKTIDGGLLIQTYDTISAEEVTNAKIIGDPLTNEEYKNAQFAWHVVKQLSSNAICIVKDEGTIGMCSGNTNRVDAVTIAIQRASRSLPGSVLASDGFFPFDDSVKVAANFKIKVLVQPGGSVNDPQVIEAVKKFKMKMVMTGTRHFRH